MRNYANLANRVASHKKEAIKSLKPARERAIDRADLLWEARQAQKKGAVIRTKERELMQGHAFDLFPTPPELAKRMVNLCDDPIFSGASTKWLEPSAGTGRIAQAIRNAGHEPICIELSYSAYEFLVSRCFDVTQGDFLELDPTTHKADVILMNPPFSNGQDIDHVKHAFEILGEGGRIVAIMSEGSFHRSDNKAKQFREWLEDVCHWTEELEPGTFKSSGTNVKARLVVIDK